MKIWKYKIPIEDDFIIKMPRNAHVLCVQTKHDLPYIWVKTSGDVTDLFERSFIIVGTGRYFNAEGLIYIGTFQQYNGGLVWHLFERLQ
jgi:hypothetical protein